MITVYFILLLRFIVTFFLRLPVFLKPPYFTKNQSDCWAHARVEYEMKDSQRATWYRIGNNLLKLINNLSKENKENHYRDRGLDMLS